MTAPSVLIVEARFYAHIADLLVAGTLERLRDAGASVERLDVPGVFEIPGAIGYALDHFDGFVALGCVIRGETSHYDYVCGESARGLQALAIERGAAIGYGILTVENEAQALARADPARKNKGLDAAEACLRMIDLKRRFAVPNG